MELSIEPSKSNNDNKIKVSCDKTRHISVEEINPSVTDNLFSESTLNLIVEDTMQLPFEDKMKSPAENNSTLCTEDETKILGDNTTSLGIQCQTREPIFVENQGVQASVEGGRNVFSEGQTFAVVERQNIVSAGSQILDNAVISMPQTSVIGAEVSVLNNQEHRDVTELECSSAGDILTKTRQVLEDRFSIAKTIPGTRGFHHFTPVSEDSIGTKRISSDDKFSTIFHFSGQQPPAIKVSQISTNSYVACIYDNHWFFGLVLSKHEEEGDVKVKFMHPYSPALPPQKEDICYVRVCNIISRVSPPITKGSGRLYYFSQKEADYAQHQYTILFTKRLHDFSGNFESAIMSASKIPEGNIVFTDKEFFSIKVLNRMLPSLPVKRRFNEVWKSPETEPNDFMKKLKQENFLTDPVSWFIDKKIASAATSCPGCPNKALKAKRTFVFADGYAWFCETCKRVQPFMRPPFFDKYRYPLISLLAAVYHWTYQSDCEDVLCDTGLPIAAVIELYQDIQHTCSISINNFEHRAERMVMPGEILEMSIFRFGSYLLIAALERNTKLTRFEAIPLQTKDLKGVVLKTAVSFVFTNQTVVSDCVVLKDLSSYGIKFMLAEFNAEDKIGWHCQNLINFVRIYVQDMLGRFSAQYFSLGVLQGFLDELQWRQRHGMIQELAFWSILNDLTMTSIQGAGVQQMPKPLTEVENPNKQTVESPNKQTVENPNKQTVENSNKRTVTSSPVCGTDFGPSLHQAPISTINKIFLPSGISSSVAYVADGIENFSVTSLLSVHTWPLVGYLQHTVDASVVPVNTTEIKWRLALAFDHFFEHPTKWLVTKGFAPGNTLCDMCKSGTFVFGLNENKFSSCRNNKCGNVQPFKRPKFFSILSFSTMKDLLILLYHWAVQSTFSIISKDVRLYEREVLYVYWAVRKHCSIIIRRTKFGNQDHTYEIGIIQYGRFCIFGALNRQTKAIRLVALDAPNAYELAKLQFVLNMWLTPGTTIVTSNPGFYFNYYKIQLSDEKNLKINSYLKTVITHLFFRFNSLEMKIDMIQSFLDEVQWRQMFGSTPESSFLSLLSQLSWNIEIEYSHEISASRFNAMMTVNTTKEKRSQMSPTRSSTEPPAKQLVHNEGQSSIPLEEKQKINSSIDRESSLNQKSEKWQMSPTRSSTEPPAKQLVHNEGQSSIPLEEKQKINSSIDRESSLNQKSEKWQCSVLSDGKEISAKRSLDGENKERPGPPILVLKRQKIDDVKETELRNKSRIYSNTQDKKSNLQHKKRSRSSSSSSSSSEMDIFDILSILSGDSDKEDVEILEVDKDVEMCSINSSTCGKELNLKPGSDEKTVKSPSLQGLFSKENITDEHIKEKDLIDQSRICRKTQDEKSNFQYKRHSISSPEMDIEDIFSIASDSDKENLELMELDKDVQKDTPMSLSHEKESSAKQGLDGENVELSSLPVSFPDKKKISDWCETGVMNNWSVDCETQDEESNIRPVKLKRKYPSKLSALEDSDTSSETSEPAEEDSDLEVDKKVENLETFCQVSKEKRICLKTVQKPNTRLLRPALKYYFSSKNLKNGLRKIVDDNKDLVALDGYYFAELPIAQENVTDKKLYIYKCNICKECLHGNIEVMRHSLKHLEDEQKNSHEDVEISCKRCFSIWDSEQELKQHIIEVHINMNSRSCLICSVLFSSSAELCNHMVDAHVPCEMPYSCPACLYRSSLHKDVLNHFAQSHQNEPHLMCPYCLKMCSPLSDHEEILFTSAYFKHLLEHRKKHSRVKCPSCCLQFFSYHEVYLHTMKDHELFCKDFNIGDALPFISRQKPCVVFTKKVPRLPLSHPATVMTSKMIQPIQEIDSSNETEKSDIQSKGINLESKKLDIKLPKTDVRSIEENIQSTKTDVHSAKTDIPSTRIYVQSVNTIDQAPNLDIPLTKINIPSIKTGVQLTNTNCQSTKVGYQSTKTYRQSEKTLCNSRSKIEVECLNPESSNLSEIDVVPVTCNENVDVSDIDETLPLQSLCHTEKMSKPSQKSGDIKYVIGVNSFCLECGNSVDENHFFKPLNCRCGYATCCPNAFSLHIINKHSLLKNRKSTKTLSSKRVFLHKRAFCNCLFSSSDPDLLASHLKNCTGVIHLSNSENICTNPNVQKKLPEYQTKSEDSEIRGNVKETVQLSSEEGDDCIIIDSSPAKSAVEAASSDPLTGAAKPSVTRVDVQMDNVPTRNDFVLSDVYGISQSMTNASVQIPIKDSTRALLKMISQNRCVTQMPNEVVSLSKTDSCPNNDVSSSSAALRFVTPKNVQVTPSIQALSQLVADITSVKDYASDKEKLTKNKVTTVSSILSQAHVPVTMTSIPLQQSVPTANNPLSQGTVLCGNTLLPQNTQLIMSTLLPQIEGQALSQQVADITSVNDCASDKKTFTKNEINTISSILSQVHVPVTMTSIPLGQRVPTASNPLSQGTLLCGNTLLPQNTQLIMSTLLPQIEGQALSQQVADITSIKDSASGNEKLTKNKVATESSILSQVHIPVTMTSAPLQQSVSTASTSLSQGPVLLGNSLFPQNTQLIMNTLLPQVEQPIINMSFGSRNICMMANTALPQVIYTVANTSLPQRSDMRSTSIDGKFAPIAPKYSTFFVSDS